ncbi:unnamed protein product [Peniophora sp. CBMAI 1063]|nr:unnamed protein product [Peniophora sp. CBMAI 1063]
MGKRKRSAAKRAERDERFDNSKKAKKLRLDREATREHVVADHFDDAYRHRPAGFSQDDVKRIAARWECDPAQLPVDSFADSCVVWNPHNRDEPLVARFVDIVRADGAQKIINAYDEMMCPLPFVRRDPHQGVPKHMPKKCDVNRASDSGAHHFGTWETTGNKPRITSESRAPLQNPYAIRKIDNLLSHIKAFVVPPLARAIRRYFPEQARWRDICTDRARRHCAEIYRDRPALDLGDGFHAIAIKDGSSDLLHIDMHDGLMAFIIALGDWLEEGYLVIPQLGVKFRIPPRSAFGFLASLLAHFTTPPVGGRRIVITCFTDRFLLKHALEELALGEAEPI